MSLTHHRRKSCRICSAETLRIFLELGPTPLANSFLSSTDQFGSEAFYPLDVAFCESCSLVQLVDVIDPEVLFRDYVYVSGTSDTMAAHHREYARTVAALLNLQPGDLVMEAASNDGTLLKAFQQLGLRTLGIEPASNIAAMAEVAGVPTVNEFLNARSAAEIREEHGPARALAANNVLAHVDEPVDFLKSCRTLIEPGGLLTVEVPYGGEMLDRLEYDTIYHEHLCYFSVTALLRLFGEAGMHIARIDHLPVHGGSLRIYAVPGIGEHAATALDMAREECRRGLSSIERYDRFAKEVASNRAAVRALLGRFQAEGRSVAGYGAPAKGNTLLNYCGIGPDVLPYTVDKNPLKVGKFTPGMHIPVLPSSTLLERQPDYVLILAWNFANEIMRQQSEYRERGGRFVTPAPRPAVI